jgi:hypothetical protein
MIAAIRPTEAKDLRALAQFLARVYKFESSDSHANPRVLEWKYLYPRAGWQGGRSYLLERGGNIVAHAGVCPASFRLPTGQTVGSLEIVDWAADPSSPGVGIAIYRELMKMAPTTFVIGGAPATRQMVPRIGFRVLGEALTYTAWLRPWREFRTRPRTVRSVLRLLHGMTHPVAIRSRPSAQWAFSPVNEFDDSLQPVLNGVKRTWTFGQRTVADLNYLLQCPHLKMQGFLLWRQGQLVGYFILGRAGWEARLLDLVVDSADASDWNLACESISSAAQLDSEVCRIRALTSFPMLTQALAWNGYWCQCKEPIALYDPTDALERAFPVSFQLFDGDSGY